MNKLDNKSDNFGQFLYLLKYMLYFSIPGIGQIIALIYAFWDKTDPNRTNIARAILCYILIFYILLLIGWRFQLGQFVCQ